MYIKKILFLVIISSLILGCTRDGTFDPTRTNEVFSGITYTGKDGELLAPTDPDDWNLYSGKSPYITPYKIFGINEPSKNGIPLLPTHFAVGPAYVNPSLDSVVIPIDVPVASKYKVKLIDVNFHSIVTFSNKSEAGRVEVIWDLSDSRGNKVPKGIYRAVYEITADDGNRIYSAYGHGDIWIK